MTDAMTDAITDTVTEPVTGAGTPNYSSSHSSPRRWTRSSAAILIAVYLGLALVTQLFLQSYGERYLDSTLVKATAAYALARGLGGAISVVQESTVSAGFVVEGTVAVGQVLRPVSALLEQFSWVMLLSVVSLGVQKLLLLLGVRAGLALFGVALALLGLHWLLTRDRPNGPKTSALGVRLLLMATLVHAAVPLSSALGAASDALLTGRYTRAEAALSDVQRDLRGELGEGERWYERFDPRAVVGRVSAAVSEASAHAIDLMVIFVFQTVLLPLLTLVVLLYLFGSFSWRRLNVD